VLAIVAIKARNSYLEFTNSSIDGFHDDCEILKQVGKISTEIAKIHDES